MPVCLESASKSRNNAQMLIIFKKKWHSVQHLKFHEYFLKIQASDIVVSLKECEWMVTRGKKTIMLGKAETNRRARQWILQKNRKKEIAGCPGKSD